MRKRRYTIYCARVGKILYIDTMRLFRDQEAMGSNPVTPTIKKDLQKQVLFSIYLCIFTDIFLCVFGLFK